MKYATINIITMPNIDSNPDSSGALAAGFAVDIEVGLGSVVNTIDDGVDVGFGVGVAVGIGVAVGVGVGIGVVFGVGIGDDLIIDDSGGLQTLQGRYPAAIASSGVSKLFKSSDLIFST